MNNFRYQCVWQTKDEALKQEITAFWIKEGAMANSAAAAQRLPQVIFLAREENGTIAAVSSIYEQYNEQLKNSFYYMRTFIPTRFQETNIAPQLIIHIRDYLNESFVSGSQRKNIGLILEVQDPVLQKKHNDAIWPESGMVYVGKNAQGAHQRVVYFSDAHIA
jgi:hypothetical protein